MTRSSDQPRPRRSHLDDPGIGRERVPPERAAHRPSTAGAAASGAQANIEGPAPEIEQPSAPASMAPRRTS